MKRIQWFKNLTVARLLSTHLYEHFDNSRIDCLHMHRIHYHIICLARSPNKKSHLSFLFRAVNQIHTAVNLLQEQIYRLCESFFFISLSLFLFKNIISDCFFLSSSSNFCIRSEIVVCRQTTFDD